MKQVRQAFIISSVLMLAIWLGSCATMVETLDQLNLLTDEEEVKLGAEVVKEVETKEQVLADPKATAYIEQIGQKIAPHLPSRSFGYSFKILQGDEINAFATPGGHCYVYTGLIKFADNEGQLAGVIAHECSHVAAEHIGRQLTKMYAFQQLTQAVVGEDPSTVEQIAFSLVGTGIGMKFSRSQEFEADQFGAEAMYNAGYNPTCMVQFFRKLEDKYGSGPSGITKYLSTHPPTSERIERLQTQTASYQISERHIIETTEFHTIKASLK